MKLPDYEKRTTALPLVFLSHVQKKLGYIPKTWLAYTFFHGTELGRYPVHIPPDGLIILQNTISRTDTIAVYSENAIEVNGKDFELVDANSSSKFLLFKDEFHGNCKDSVFLKNTYKYEENTGNSRIEMVPP